MVLQPQRDKSLWFGLFRFRSPLLTESILFLFLRLLRCFTSPRIALPGLCIQPGVIPLSRDRVSPFGYLRIKACLPLPEAFRSLPRPSSPDDAKASTSCFLSFELQTPFQALVLPTNFLLTLNCQRTKSVHFRSAFPVHPVPFRFPREPAWWAHCSIACWAGPLIGATAAWSR